MKNHFIKQISAFCIFVFTISGIVTLSSCVSVSVPFGPVPKAEKPVVKEPSSPFVTLASNTADEAWISEKTGNTISYLSECKKNNVEIIDDIAIDATSAIDQSKIVKTTHGFINSHKSSEVIVSGKVDSHKIKMAISVFKSGDCIFSITYGGLEDKFDEDLNEFELFKLGFRAP